MLKLRLTLSLFFGLLLTSFSQKDSLENIIRTSDNDSTLMNSYLLMSDEYYRIAPDSCQYFAEKSYKYALKLHDRFLIPAIENIIGLCELHKENYLDALKWFNKSLEGLIAIQSERSVLMGLNNIGACYSELQQPVKALPYLLKAQEFSEKLDHNDVLMLSELNLGNVYGDLNQLKLSEEFFRKSRSRISADEDPYNYSLNTYNIANIILRDEGRGKEPLALLTESFEISMNHQFYNLAFMATNNLATFYIESDHMDLDSAEFWLKKSDSVLAKNSYPTAELFLKIAYAQFYRVRKEFDKSLDCLLEGKTYFSQVQEGELQYKYQFELAETFEIRKDYKNAYENFKAASLMKESLYNNKNTKIFADLKNNYELEKKDQEIALSEKDNALKDQKISADQNRIKVFIWGTVFLVILLGFIVYFLIQKNRNNKLLVEQNLLIEQQRASIENKQTEIIDSINYASRIQTAILPETSVLNSLLKNGFVLYLPKDVVSGDFYWTEQVSEDEVLVAVADCTGHGVPGAMVSIVCNNALNRAVREFSLVCPAKILDKTREIVVSEFQQHDGSVKDGMDISLANINFKQNKVKWAGANNPLWIVRDDNKNQIEEIKADKQPIGQFQKAKPFTVHELNVNKGDTLFLFSDGFADQFGGAQGKKLKNKAFKAMLCEFSHHEINEVKGLLENKFLNWKGSFEQLDDVCVIGINFV